MEEGGRRLHIWKKKLMLNNKPNGRQKVKIVENVQTRASY